MQHSSKAAKGLYEWMNAIRTYYFVYRESAPIRNKLVMADLQLKRIKEKKRLHTEKLLMLQEELRKMRDEQKAKEEEI